MQKKEPGEADAPPGRRRSGAALPRYWPRGLAFTDSAGSAQSRVPAGRVPSWLHSSLPPSPGPVPGRVSALHGPPRKARG